MRQIDEIQAMRDDRKSFRRTWTNNTDSMIRTMYDYMRSYTIRFMKVYNESDKNDPELKTLLVEEIRCMEKIKEQLETIRDALMIE